MKRIMITAVVLLLCSLPCYGVGVSVPGLEALEKQTEAYGVEADTDFQTGVEHMLRDQLGELEPVMRSGGGTVLRMMAVVLLCGVAEGAREGGESLRAVEIAGALAITALTMGDMERMLGLGRTAIDRMDSFSQALLPVMAVLTAAAGSPAAAAVRQGITVLFSQLLLRTMDGLLIPLVYAYTAVCCASAAVGTQGLDKLAGLLKKGVTLLLTGLLLAFVAYLTASGAVAGSADAAAVKTAKMAMTRLIPVVGGILGDASETVLAGASALRGTVGAAGMLTVLAICLEPFLHLAVHYGAYKVTAALCALVAQPGLSRLIDAIGGAFGIVLGMGVIYNMDNTENPVFSMVSGSYPIN